ncbi:MAG TPA: universal stress protein [Nitrososphaeraceae archaeon]|jgi:nucleotide-binding universal stress UspA family protein
MTKNAIMTDVNSNCNIQIRRILVPIDGSKCSLNAARYAVKLAKDENAQLFCIHVNVGLPYGYERAPPNVIDQYFNDLEEKTQSWFKEVKDMARNENVEELKTEILTDVKSIIESIIDYATSKDVDLIVIGTRGRTGLKRFLTGSIASGVVQHAHCSVMIVR